MNAVRIPMPRVSETVDQSFIASWLVSVGECVKVDQPILQVETDKAIVEITSTVEGVLVQQLVEVDQEVQTGEHLAVVEVEVTGVE